MRLIWFSLIIRDQSVRLLTMHLTRYTDLSIRVLVYLAIDEKELSIISDIAERYQVSKNHLTKIVHQLSKNDYIHTVRGKYGGIRLHRLPESINIGRLVREMEPDFDLVECFTEKNNCLITPTCSLKTILENASQAFLAELDQYTLADVIRQQDRPMTAKILHLNQFS